MGGSQEVALDVCTGNLEQLVEGTASATFTGGILLSAEVTLGAAATVLFGWSFTCDYGMLMAAYAEGGYDRIVHLQVKDTVSGERTTVGPACSYDGIARSSCNTPETGYYMYLHDTFTGQGVSPIGVDIPTAVSVCPALDPAFEAFAWNDSSIGIPFTGVSSNMLWACEEFGIHWN